jgi:hypothetical protein
MILRLLLLRVYRLWVLMLKLRQLSLVWALVRVRVRVLVRVLVVLVAVVAVVDVTLDAIRQSALVSTEKLKLYFYKKPVSNGSL